MPSTQQHKNQTVSHPQRMSIKISSGVGSIPEPKQPEQVDQVMIPTWKKATYLLLAGFFFVLGAIGVILPGLPTTPFLLLTSYFLVRSFPKLNDALLNSYLFGSILTDWQIGGGVRPKVKVQAMTVVALLVAASIYLSDYTIWFSSIVVSLASLGLVVIWKLPSVKR